MSINALLLALAALTPPLDPVRTDGADAGLIVTTPHLPLGAGDCGIYPFTYYDGTCAHPAWDIGSVYGGFHIFQQPVFSVSGGTIAALDPDGFCGIDVFVDHGDGVFSRYCHLDSIAGDLFVGMAIGQRHVIGFLGTTGAGAPHLHFEARSGGIYGAYIDLGDPLAFFEAPVVSPCGELDYFGRCDGAVLSWCENNEVRVVDCAGTGQLCAYQDDVIGNNCVAAPIVEEEVPIVEEEQPIDEEPIDEDPLEEEEPIDEDPLEEEEPITPVAARDALVHALPIEFLELDPRDEDVTHDQDPGIVLDDANGRTVVAPGSVSCASAPAAPVFLAIAMVLRRKRRGS